MATTIINSTSVKACEISFEFLIFNFELFKFLCPWFLVFMSRYVFIYLPAHLPAYIPAFLHAFFLSAFCRRGLMNRAVE